MKRRIWIWVLATLVVLVAALLLVRRSNAGKDEAAYQEQLRLARQEGLPTTWQEYAAQIPAVEPSENAGLIYQQIHAKQELGPKGLKNDVQLIDIDLTFHPDAKKVAEAEAIVAQYREAVATADKAVALPKCNFNRDWSEGAATLFPEFRDMKAVAKLVALRGSIAASRGDFKTAIENIQRVFAVANHAGSDPNVLSALVRENTYLIGLRDLVDWSFVHRDQPAYREALRKAVAAFPRVQLKREYSDDLYIIISMVELTQTPEGRAKLGLKESDIGQAEKIIPLLTNQIQAKTRMVRAERAFWAALDRPPKDRQDLIEKAKAEVLAAMGAFPTAGNIYQEMGTGDRGASTRELESETRRLEYLAALRALEEPVLPRAIKTMDLISPSNGKPVRYEFDGKQINITVNPDSESSQHFKIPPDPPLKF